MSSSRTTDQRPRFLTSFDGSGRKPRDIQIQALDWISDNWDSQILAISAPVASGKSAISKAIINTVGGHILTPTNLLIDQYTDDYKGDNYLKGMTHYSCSPQMTCYEWINECEQKACPECPYKRSKDRAQVESTFFNPMSYWYYTFSEGYEPPPVLVVDEAHTLLNSLMLLCGVRLKFSEYRFPKDCTDEIELAKWIDKTAVKLERLKELSKNDRKRVLELSKEIKRLKMTAAGIHENPQNYAIWQTTEKIRGKEELILNLKPLTVPRYIAKRILNAGRVVLLSGTLLDTDVKELVGSDPYQFLDLPSPIDKSRRRVYYRPAPFRMNYTTKPQDIVNLLESVVKEHPGENTIIHVSYSLSKKLRNLFTVPIIFNDPDDKDTKLAQFKREGGIFLAAGCAEGIDLKDDLARVNIIPKLLFPDLNDPVVKKRKALADGDEWYGQQTLKTLIQQCGRTTRSETDSSVTYILDPTFPMVYSKNKHRLPNYFKESLVWARKE